MKDDQEITPLDSGLADLLGYNPVWYWIMIFIVLAIVILTLFLLLRLKSKKESASAKTAQPIVHPAYFASEIDKAFLMVANKAITTQEACQRVSIILREFLQIKTGLPANAMTITDLMKAQAPVKVIESIKYIYPIVFSDKQVATYDEFVQFMNSSRAVIDGKWN